MSNVICINYYIGNKYNLLRMSYDINRININININIIGLYRRMKNDEKYPCTMFRLDPGARCKECHASLCGRLFQSL